MCSLLRNRKYAHVMGCEAMPSHPERNVIGSLQGSCGLCDIPESSTCTTVDCILLITGPKGLAEHSCSIPLCNTLVVQAAYREQRLGKGSLCNRKNTRGHGLWGKTQVSARVRSTSGEPRVVPQKPGPE